MRRRSATSTASDGRRKCTLHQQAREKNDERVYARLNLFNVETCWAVVRCLEIIKAIQHQNFLLIINLLYIDKDI